MDELEFSNTTGEIRVDTGEEPSTEQMEAYFSSIEGLFRDTLQYRRPEGAAEPLMGYAISALVLSVVPIFPMISWALFQWRFADLALKIRGISIPIHSWGLWWVLWIFASISTLWLLGKINDWTVPSKKPDLLEPAHMRFALCFALSRELTKYRTNKLKKHIQEARSLWSKLEDSLKDLWGHRQYVYYDDDIEIFPQPTERSFIAGSIPVDHHVTLTTSRRKRSFFAGYLSFEKKFGWFKLAGSTKRIVDAFDSLLSKVPPRIRDKKDTNALAEIFMRLAAYFYTRIPELSDGRPESLPSRNAAEEHILLRFAEAIDSLPIYVSESRSMATNKEPEIPRFRKFMDWVLRAFDSEVLLLRFFAWLSMVSIIVGVISGVLLHYVPSLKVELVLTVALPTPFAVAGAALAAQLRKRG